MPMTPALFLFVVCTQGVATQPTTRPATTRPAAVRLSLEERRAMIAARQKEKIKVGMTVAAANKALKGYRCVRGNDFDDTYTCSWLLETKRWAGMSLKHEITDYYAAKIRKGKLIEVKHDPTTRPAN